MIAKKCIERKSLHLFTEVLDVKIKPSVFRVGADKSNRKALRSGSMFWSSIPKRKGHTKNNEQVKKFPLIVFYNILRLCSTQLPIIALYYLLMITLNHSWFQNLYFKCLSGNFIIAW